MHFQIFVKGLDGRTKCLQTSSSRLEIKTLKEKLSDLLKTPPEFQRLVSGTRQIADEGFIVAENDGFFPQINVLLRLRAGKGGFGSLLRGAATKAGQKKTNNNDACRDMSGRRLRHVNAEKKLEEWKAEAEERQLEKIAEVYLKKQMKMKKKADPKLDEGAKDVEKYRVEASRAMEMVESAVKDGVLEALKLQRNGKRKMEDAVKLDVKRHKLWMLEEDEAEENEDTDEEIEDAKHEECLIKGNEECGSSHTSNSESASDSGIPSPSGIGSPGSGSCDDGEANVKFQTKELKSLVENGNCCDGRETCTELEKEMIVALISTEGKNITHANIHHNTEANVEVKTEEPISSYGENVSGSDEKKECVDSNKVPVTSNNIDGQNIISHNMDETEIMSNMAGQTSQIRDSDRSTSEINFGSKSIITNVSVEIDSVCDSNSNIGEPLNFDSFNTAKEMEGLGLERLKNELESCGLKCGGSLSERAARLFLLKTTPLEKLPKKHFAKSKVVGK